MRRWAARLAAVLILAVLASGAGLAADPKFPPLTGRVVDNAGLLSPPAAQQLTGKLEAHEEKTGQQVVVAIVPSLQGQTIEDYGYQLGRFWGIGQKDRNTGAILLVAPKEHKVRIEVGYGLEGTLSDAKCSDIINEVILPSFKKGDMQGGIVAGTAAVLNALEGTEAADKPADQPLTLAPQNPKPSPLVVIGTLVLVGFIFIRLARGGMNPGAMLAGALMANSWSSNSGGGSSDSFSGGGGSFGGGGASGSW